MVEKYDKIGTGYNQTRKPDPYLLSRFYHHLKPQSGNIYLDIGCGTGNYTIELHKKGIQFIGIDPSEKMLEIAKEKNEQIDWKVGTAEQIPLQDEAVDGIIASLTLHHWSDLKKGFSELNRVLKPGKKVIIFTATPKQMQGYWLNHYFPKMLQDSIVQMPTFDLVKSCLVNNGFKISELERYFIRPDLEDFFLYAGKHNPNLYLEAQVRRGISSFSHLANAAEVKAGLAKLSEDILTQKVNDIIREYENEDGDYLYIIAEKAVLKN